jgi:hypothetical protein
LFELGGVLDRSLLLGAAQRLGEETGLPFMGSWFGRIGAFDVLAFPAAFADETARVQAKVHGRSGIAVSVDLKGLEDIEGLVVRCRQRTQGLTLSDVLHSVAISQSQVVEVLFEGPQGGPFATHIEVWVREAGSEQSRLLQEHTFYWIRRIHFGMNIIEGHASMRAPWLDAFTRAKKTRLRGESLARITRMAVQETKEIGEPYAAFEEVAKRRGELRARVLPKSSGAHFFPVGAGADGSRLAIAEWFCELGTADDRSVLVVDPFFDAWGLELISRAQLRECTIITAFQHRKNGDEAEARILASLEQLAPLLEGRALSITEIRSSGRQAPFHDRYILLVGASGLAKKGFHLSNSLQAAAVSHPLLVTPIGDDVLEEVANYVGGLLDVPVQQSLQAEAPGPVWKREIVASKQQPTPEPPDVPPAEDIQLLLSRVLSAEAEELFVTEWASLSHALAHIAGDDVFDRVADEGGERLAARLATVISGSPGREPPFGTQRAKARAESIALLQHARATFFDVVQSADRYIEHWHDRPGRPWSLHFATRLLAERNSAALVRAADILVSQAPIARVHCPRRRPLPKLSSTSSQLSLSDCTA